MLDDFKCGVATLPLCPFGQTYPPLFAASSHKSSMIHWYVWPRSSHQFWVVRDWPDKPIKYPSTIHKISITYLQHIHKNVLKVSMFPTPKSPVTPTSPPQVQKRQVVWWVGIQTRNFHVRQPGSHESPSHWVFTPQILWLEKCFDRFLEEKTRKLFCLKVWLYDILLMAQKTKYSYQDQIMFYLYAKPVSSFEICVKCDFFQGEQEIQYTALDMFD